jgi:hypothetical protein
MIKNNTTDDINNFSGTNGYFDQKDPEEESIIEIDTQISQMYEKLESIYNQIVPLNNYIDAKKKSLSERVRLKLTKNKDGKTFTYGEMTFRTMSYIFEVIRCRFGQDAIKPGDFYDLGSVKIKI